MFRNAQKKIMFPNAHLQVEELRGGQCTTKFATIIMTYPDPIRNFILANYCLHLVRLRGPVYQKYFDGNSMIGIDLHSKFKYVSLPASWDVGGIVSIHLNIFPQKGMRYLGLQEALPMWREDQFIKIIFDENCITF